MHKHTLTCGMLVLHHKTAGICSAQSRRAVYSYKENKVHVRLSVELMSHLPSDSQGFLKKGFISSEARFSY